jgi:hypothetical protein
MISSYALIALMSNWSDPASSDESVIKDVITLFGIQDTAARKSSWTEGLELAWEDGFMLGRPERWPSWGTASIIYLKRITIIYR